MQESSALPGTQSQPRLLHLTIHATISSEIQTPAPLNDGIIGSEEGYWPRSLLTGLGKWWSSSKHGDVAPSCSVCFCPCGVYIAVLDWLRITFFTRENEFKEAVGSNTGTFDIGYYTCGAWIEHYHFFAASTSNNVVVLLDTTGKELSRICMNQSKSLGCIRGLFSQRMLQTEPDGRSQLVAFTSACDFYKVGVSSAGFSGMDVKALVQSSLRRMYPQGVICHDYNDQRSVLAVIGLTSASRFFRSTGQYCLSVWHTGDFCRPLEILGCINHLEEFHPPSMTVSSMSNFLAPKLIMSPDCNFIGILDACAHMQLVSSNQDSGWSLQKVHFPALEHISTSEVTPRKNTTSGKSNVSFFEMMGAPYEQNQGGLTFKSFRNVCAFCWWSKNILAVLGNDSILSLINVDDLRIRSRCAIGFICEALYTCQASERRQIFLLEKSGEKVTHSDREGLELIANRAERSAWRLLSLEELSVLELFKVLLDNAEFDSALTLAKNYGLKTETIYKARWLRSDFELESMQQNLPKIEDTAWVLKECLEKVCPSVEAMNGLLQYGFSLVDSCLSFENVEAAANNPSTGAFCSKRLRLLQFKDRLETYLALSMGRYNPKDYELLRSSSLPNVAINLAELGKLGALVFLYKRHLYTLASSIFKILDAIPETIPPHSYTELLPLGNPPPTYTGRERDWVEDLHILDIIKKHGSINGNNRNVRLEDSTEHMVRLYSGFAWPSEEEIVNWYKTRALAIDSVSGQVENALSLLDWGKQNGLTGLASLWEEVSDFHRVVYKNAVYKNADVDDANLSLQDWQCLGDFEKFKVILKGVNEFDVLDRLREQALPFLKRRDLGKSLVGGPLAAEREEKNLLAEWMKEIACKQLRVCAAIFDEACKNSSITKLFETDAECIEAGLDCVYACTGVDQWDIMMMILSKLSLTCLQSQSAVTVEEASTGKRSKWEINPHSLVKTRSLVPSHFIKKDSGIPIKEGVYVDLKAKIDVAMGHVEAGKLLSHYQVPKPIAFFESAKNDDRVVKQLIHLLLSKFGRRYPERSDSEWALVWEDLQKLQATAFPFLNKQFLFLEYYRGLLKAGKFYLAKSQLKNLGSSLLSLEKAEAVIVQAAREYFYSASSLECAEIEKARLCLHLLPESKTLATELGIIDAVTVKLPALGVSLLPMQVRQVKDPMEIVKMALNNCSLNGNLEVDDILDVASSLGLNTSAHIAMVEEAIAREAAANGQISLVLNLCLSLMKKGHGSVWDLCAALARGPEVEGMSLQTRKKLLGFALSFCDEASVEQLLITWKEIDYLKQCFDLKAEHGVDLQQYKKKSKSGSLKGDFDEGQEPEKLRQILSKVVHNDDIRDLFGKNNVPKDKKKLLDILCSELSWILQNIENEGLESSKDFSEYSWNTTCTNMVQQHSRRHKNQRSNSIAFILMGLGHSDLLPKNELVCHLARLAMRNLSNDRKSFIGCGYLLNLTDYYLGANILEQELHRAEKLEERCEIMKLAYNYGSLQHATERVASPKQRKGKLYMTLRNSDFTAASGNIEADMGDSSSSFSWTDWQKSLSQSLHTAEHALVLEEFIPSFEMERFVGGDEDYVKHSVYKLVESATIVERNEEVQPSCVDRYRSVASAILEAESGEGEKLNLYINSLEERYSIFKSYIRYLDIKNQWVCIQFLTHATSKSVLDRVDNQEPHFLTAVCNLLKFWVSVCEDSLRVANTGTNDALSKQAIQSLTEFKSCCNSFKSIIEQRRVTEMQVKEVIAKVGVHSDCWDGERKRFVSAMISSGCPFQAAVLFWRSTGKNLVSNEVTGMEMDEAHNLAHTNTTLALELSVLYADFVGLLINGCSKASGPDDCDVLLEALGKVIGSLSGSEQEGLHAFPELHEVRLCVWETLCRSAEDLNFPLFLRVCLLELLEAVSSLKEKNTKGGLATNAIRFMVPWDDWDKMGAGHKKALPGPSIQHTVVALKSTELLSSTWPDVEVKGEDLLSVEGATTVFKSLAVKVMLSQHATLLRRLLELWVNIFGYEDVVVEGVSGENKTKEVSEKGMDSHDGWSQADDWDDVWEEETDNLAGNHGLTDGGLSVHSLHALWKHTLEQLAFFGLVTDMIGILDDMSLDPGKVLLTKQETFELISALEKSNPVLALKVSLLLPYLDAQKVALASVNNRLGAPTSTVPGRQSEGSTIEEGVVVDGCVLILVLASGQLSTLADEPKFSVLFLHMCATMVSSLQDTGRSSHLMHEVVFPLFIARLAQTSQYAIACALVLQSMRAHPALISWNGAYAAMHNFLSTKSAVLRGGKLDISSSISEYEPLVNTVNNLQGHLSEILGSTLQHCFK